MIHNGNFYAIYFTDGEYDSHRQCTVGLAPTASEAKKMCELLNYYVELCEATNSTPETNPLEFESEVWREIYDTYSPNVHEAHFDWEVIHMYNMIEDN